MRCCVSAARASALRLLSLVIASWSAAALPAPVRPTRRPAVAKIIQDDHARLVFAQLQATEEPLVKKRLEHEELHRVVLGFDIQEMRGSDGLTMVFDKKEKLLRLDMGMQPVHGLAWGHFDDRVESTGWSELYVETTTNRLISNDVRMYSAGFVEGVLTAVRISEFNANTRHLLIRKDASDHALSAVMRIFEEQLRFVKGQTSSDTRTMSEEPKDPYDKHIRYVFFQLWGLADGYNAIAKFFQVKEISLVDLFLLNSAGELPQLMEAFTSEAIASRAANHPSFLQRHTQRARSRPSRPVSHPTAEGDDLWWERHVVGSGRCSGLVRIADDNQDLLIGHTTWDDYSKMTRIFKYYKLALEGADTIATQIAFSSYPGVVSSTDDFYVTDSGLGILETSLIVLEPLRWDFVMEKPHSPNFMHIMAVNRLATDAAHWAKLFTSANTGTYTSQWLVVDYKQFDQGKPLPDNSFWVAEVVPGVTHSADMTPYLREHGYFPSFNRPFFSDVREACGYDQGPNQGAMFSWDDNPRAKIFKQKAPNVNGLAEMRLLMDENLHMYAGGGGASPGHEISARMDLATEVMIPNGGIDAKVVSACLVQTLNVQAVSGPSHRVLPPFRWLKPDGIEAWPGFPHIGQPSVWNFSFVQMTPVGQGPIEDIAVCT